MKCERCGDPMGPDDLVVCATCSDELEAKFAPITNALLELASDPDFIASLPDPE